MRNDGYWSLLISIDYLKDLLDVVDVPDHLLELLHNDCFLYDFLHLSDGFVFVLYLYDLLVLLHDFFYLLNDNRHLNDLLYDLLNVSVHIHQLRNYSLHFYYLWYFYHYL